MATRFMADEGRKKTFVAILNGTSELTDDGLARGWIAMLKRALSGAGVIELAFDGQNALALGFGCSNGIIEAKVKGGQILDIVKANAERPHDDVISLLALAEAKIASPEVADAWYAKFTTLRQEDTESLSAFSNRVFTIAAVATVSEKDAVRRIREQLIPFWASKLDFAAKSLSDKASWLDYAAKADNVYAAEVIRQAKDPALMANVDDIAPDGVDDAHEMLAIQNRSRQCFNCGGVGHMKRDCPSPPGMNAARRRGRGRSGGLTQQPRGQFRGRGDGRGYRQPYYGAPNDANAVSQFRRDGFGAAPEGYWYPPPTHEDAYTVQQEYDDLFYEGDYPYEINEMQYDCMLSLQRGKKLVIPVSINQHLTTGLVDCGASIVLVRPEFSSKTLRKGYCPVRYGNGATEVLRTRTLLRLSIDGVRYNVWAWVANDLPYNIVLGNEFLAGRASIDLVNYVITFKQSKEDNIAFVCDTQATSPEVYRKYAIEKRDKDIAAVQAKITDLPLRKLVVEYIWKFWELNKEAWNPCSFPAYRIEVSSTEAPYGACRSSQKEAQFVDDKVEEWIMRSCTRPSISRYGAPTLLVPKKQYEGILAKDLLRTCINYKRLNDITVKSRYPMPYLEDSLDRIRGNKFTGIDLEDGYHQQAIHEEDIHKSGYVTPSGKHFEMTRVHYGMCNAGTEFQKNMDELFSQEPKLLHKICEIFIDDLAVYSFGDSKHLKDVRAILDRLLSANLKPNWIKSQWGLPEIVWCGRNINADGIGLDMNKAQGLIDLAEPNTLPKLRMLIGLCVWHKRWINHYGDKMEPLHRLLRDAIKFKPDTKLPWGEMQSLALKSIKKDIVQHVRQSRSGPGTYHLYVDASQYAASSQLVREYQGVKHLMGYGSHTFNATQRNYSTPKQEFFAIWKAIKTFWWYLVGRDVVIHTDHQAWQKLNLRKPTGIIARMLIDINAISPRVMWIKGVRNIVADCISRLVPMENEDVLLTYDVPPSLRQAIIAAYHGGNTGAHLSAPSLLRDLRQKYHWEGMGKNVAEYIASCTHCHEFKQADKELRGPLMPLPVFSKPWQCVGVDLVGPITLPNGERKWFMIVQDYFSKQCLIRKLRDCKEDTWCNTFLTEVCWTYDNPEWVISDGGVQIVGKAFQEFCRVCGITHNYSSKYHQQGNGQVESCVKTLKPILLSKLFSDKMKWGMALKAAESAYNKHLVSRTTGFTPHQSLYGSPYNSEEKNVVRKHLELMSRIRHDIQSNSAVAKAAQISQYNKTKGERNINKGDLVLVRNFAKKATGQPEWVGPAEVIKDLGTGTYVIWDYEKGKADKVNAQHLKGPFKVDQLAGKLQLPSLANLPPLPRPSGAKPTASPPDFNHGRRAPLAADSQRPIARAVTATPSSAATRTVTNRTNLPPTPFRQAPVQPVGQAPLPAPLPQHDLVPIPVPPVHFDPPAPVQPLVLPPVVVSNRSDTPTKAQALKQGTFIKVFWTDRDTWRKGMVVGPSPSRLGGTHDVQYSSKHGPAKFVSENLLGTGSNNESVHWRISDVSTFGVSDDSPPASLTSSSSSSSSDVAAVLRLRGL
jgi:hypothetical protein